MSASLPLFVGGEIDGAVRDAVRQHLLACVPCRRDAASLQRSQRALQDAATAAAQQVAPHDEALLHQEIMARVAEIERRELSREPIARRLVLAAAALALMAFGFWWALRLSTPAALRRPPLDTSADAESAAPVRVVPWAGPRSEGVEQWLELQPAGYEPGRRSVPPGMLGRRTLHRLDAEQLVAPAAPAVRDER